MEEPMQEESMEEPQQETDQFAEAVQKVVAPMFEELKALITKDKDEPKEVELKIGGEMEPKKED